MYKVIKPFYDLQDAEHKYCVGDVYPRKGLTEEETRIAELASDKNKMGAPLIKAVKTRATKKVAE